MPQVCLEDRFLERASLLHPGRWEVTLGPARDYGSGTRVKDLATTA